MSTRAALSTIFVAWLAVAIFDTIPSAAVPLHYALAFVWFCAGVVLVWNAWRE